MSLNPPVSVAATAHQTHFSLQEMETMAGNHNQTQYRDQQPSPSGHIYITAHASVAQGTSPTKGERVIRVGVTRASAVKRAFLETATGTRREQWLYQTAVSDSTHILFFSLQDTERGSHSRLLNSNTRPLSVSYCARLWKQTD